MSYHFFAFVDRMKYIQRWGLMRSSVPENLQEHCLQTAMIAHMLACIDRTLYGGTLDPAKACLYALYHDASEIITGDLPTPVKYYDRQMRENYRRIEDSANQKLVGMLPPVFRQEFADILGFEERDAVYSGIVKAADKISAYLKCLEEEKCGSREFLAAKKSIGEKLDRMTLPCVRYFMENFVPAYSLSLDELGCGGE